MIRVAAVAAVVPAAGPGGQCSLVLPAWRGAGTGSVPGGALPGGKAPAGTGGSHWRREALDVDAEKLLAKAADGLSVRRAFGAAYEKDGILIIPVAIVAGGGGGGTRRARRGNPAAGPGGPPGEAGAVREVTPREPGQGEAGGGFGGVVLPSGAFVVKDGQVRWGPAVDVTIAVVASLGLARMLARAWGRRRRDCRRQ